jgi:hypothetical protein
MYSVALQCTKYIVSHIKHQILPSAIWKTSTYALRGEFDASFILYYEVPNAESMR